MTSKAFRTMALALPEAHEEPHFERTSFRVGKKIFATMTADGKEAMVRVVVKERLHGLLETRPDAFFSYGAWTERNGALGVHLGKVGPALARELLLDAWGSIADKKAKRAKR